MTELLVFGLSGQVGDALRPLLNDSSYRVTAVSRQQHSDEKNISWVEAGFGDFTGDDKCYEAIISLGPLDAFSTWLQSSAIQYEKIIALSSTSVVSKKNSLDTDERKLSHVLSDSEQRLSLIATSRSASLTILRPTLIYGVDRDQTVSRVLKLAKRLKFVVLPHSAAGLRQPVHVGDVAFAVLKSLTLKSTGLLTLDLPGGETLPFDQMILRSLKSRLPNTRVLRIPDLLFRIILRFASFAGRGRGLGSGFFARLGQDWVFDVTPARIMLNYQPRPFSP